MKKNGKMIIIFTALFLFTGFGLNYIWFINNPNPKLLPLNSKLPTTEIIFTPLDEKTMPIPWIGFINPDGTGLEMRSYKVPIHLFMDAIPVKVYKQSLGRIFTWSLDGESIGGISLVGSTNRQGYPVVLQMDGSISYCDPKKSIISQDRIVVLSINDVMAIEIFLDSEKQQLVIFNMETCQIDKTLYIPQGNETLKNFSFSNNHWLALEFGSSLYWQRNPQNTDFIGIRIYDPAMNIVNEIKNAMLPSLSADGKRIAYINELGEVCVAELDKLNAKCAGIAQSGISWTSDQQGLVYSNSNDNIILQNIVSREEKIIGYGYSPNWRP